MTERRPHLELVRDPALGLDELGERIEKVSAEIEELRKAINYRIARLESMFPRGTKRPA